MTCWTCQFQNITSPNTFLGLCKWFEQKGQEAKQITPTIVDIGCKFWEVKGEK